MDVASHYEALRRVFLPSLCCCFELIYYSWAVDDSHCLTTYQSQIFSWPIMDDSLFYNLGWLKCINRLNVLFNMNWNTWLSPYTHVVLQRLFQGCFVTALNCIRERGWWKFHNITASLMDQLTADDLLKCLINMDTFAFHHCIRFVW